MKPAPETKPERKGFFEDIHQRKLEIIRAEGKQAHHFYPVLDLGNFGFMLVFAIIFYGLFAAPCSFEAQGKFVGNINVDMNKINGMNNQNNAVNQFQINSFEGKVSGSAPCLAVIMQASKQN